MRTYDIARRCRQVPNSPKHAMRFGPTLAPPSGVRLRSFAPLLASGLVKNSAAMGSCCMVLGIL
eukprot:15429992-Alexandrium_andersonii.AAC.1